MSLPSIALHSWHNAALTVFQNDEVVSVIEFERFLNLKNASGDFFEPINCRENILPNLYSYLKDKFGFDRYDKFIIGSGYASFPQSYKDTIPAEQYIIDDSHHASHAYGSFCQSPFEKALAISFDGGSNDGWFNFYLAERGKDPELIEQAGVDLGSNYNVIGIYCEEIRKYHCLTAAGKLLGLQSYGEVVEAWKKPMRDFFSTRMSFFGPTSPDHKKGEVLSKEIGIDFSFSNKLSGKNSYDLARTAQQIFEDIFFEVAEPHILKHNLPIVLSGGCALNIVLNTLVKQKYGLKVFVAPNSSDCGLTVGLLCRHFKPKKTIDVTYKGIEVLDKNCLMEYVESRGGHKADMNSMVEDLTQNKILGVVQGNSEHGPRALGNRSIICSPIPSDMKDTLNLKVKHREWYRPFAPVVRLEDVSEYFEWEGESRWMNFCPKVREGYKSKLPAVTHVDGTARVQTVTREQNEFIYDLLSEFKKRTGIGVLVNTSFNVDGKPILSTYKDAFKVFDETELDRLYLDGYYFTKN
jgi:carbamoyltransferase